MRRRRRRWSRPNEGTASLSTAAASQPIATVEEGPTAPLAGTIHLIAISHLDTQWRWTVRETAALLLPRTVRDNAAAFTRYPAYRVNFDGAFRYRLLAEHHPEAFAELRRWVDAGRWCVAGATWDAMDVNLPAPESLVRHVLHGRRWFRRHLGQDPRDLFLPDCFGFGAQVPIVAAHCGVIGFATSKLRRFGDMRSAVGIPFPLGWWEGLDGSRLLAALDPGGYGEPLLASPAADPEAQNQLRLHQRLLGKGVAVRFFGIGDRGGAPESDSLATLEAAVADRWPVTTVAAGSDETFRRLARELPAERLPVHRGELLLSLHGTGCYTSQVAMKRWNAANESLAAAAERAATAAAWLGGAPYPADRLRAAWQRFLWHQFHDDLTGTSIPAAYRISWHDEAIAHSVFASTLRGAVAAVARGLDTRAAGVPLVVFNPLPRPRRELVAARLPWRGAAAVAVIGPDGEAVPAQLEERDAGSALVRFVATLPPCGFAVFDVREQATPPAASASGDSDLHALPDGLESGRYRLRLDGEGNLASLHDGALGRELLAAPLRLELFADRSRRFPAWEVRWEDLERGPVATVGGAASLRALPSGPAAVALEVRRQLGPSTFVERYRLVASPRPRAGGGSAAGDSPAIEESLPLELTIASCWRHRGRLLKLTLNATAGAPDAVYDAGVAGIARGRGSARLYEVPAQSWADLATARDDEGGGWGIAMLTDRAGGWDHPADHVLRRTLVRTPATGRRFRHQGLQDLGDHRWSLALAGHRGDWRDGDVPALGERFRQPPLPFVVAPSAGPLGRSWSFLALEGNEGGELAALKEHEEGGEWVLRLLDPRGRGGRARVVFAGGVTRCRTLDGCEDGPAADSPAFADVPPPPLFAGNAIEVQRPPFRPCTIGVVLAPPAAPIGRPRSAPLKLALDRTVVTRNGDPCRHGFGPRRLAIPAELWPTILEVDGISFPLAPGGGAAAQALAGAGQPMRLPAGSWDCLYLLAASGTTELSVALGVDAAAIPVLIPSAVAPLAREDQAVGLASGRLALWRRRAGYTRQGEVAWTVDHAHDRRGRDIAYTPLCLFVVRVPLATGQPQITLPRAPQLLVFAAAACAGTGEATAAWGSEAMRADPLS